MWAAIQGVEISFYRMPSVIKNQGEEVKELSIEQPMKWLSAISIVGEKKFVAVISSLDVLQPIGTSIMSTGSLPYTRTQKERKNGS